MVRRLKRTAASKTSARLNCRYNNSVAKKEPKAAVERATVEKHAKIEAAVKKAHAERSDVEEAIAKLLLLRYL